MLESKKKFAEKYAAKRGYKKASILSFPSEQKPTHQILEAGFNDLNKQGFSVVMSL